MLNRLKSESRHKQGSQHHFHDIFISGDTHTKSQCMKYEMLTWERAHLSHCPWDSLWNSWDWIQPCFPPACVSTTSPSPSDPSSELLFPARVPWQLHQHNSSICTPAQGNPPISWAAASLGIQTVACSTAQQSPGSAPSLRSLPQMSWAVNAACYWPASASCWNFPVLPLHWAAIKQCW